MPSRVFQMLAMGMRMPVLLCGLRIYIGSMLANLQPVEGLLLRAA